MKSDQHTKKYDTLKKNLQDQSTPIRPGEELNLENLESYLQKTIPEFSGTLRAAQFPGGYSNLTYLLKTGGREMVLRRPPFGANIKSGHDMGREYKILHALSKHYAKVPNTIAYSEDLDIIGAPFYIMERVRGIILRPGMKPEAQPDPALMRTIAEGLVDTFVELHRVDYQAVGLGDLGRPEGYISRQISGWNKRYVKAKTDEFPAVEQVAQWLQDHQPESRNISLIHNDFKYDNLILDPDDWSKVLAVLDWEMSTIGDPLMDLGTTLGYWVNPDDPDWLKQLALSPTTLAGNPTRAEIVEWYASKSGQDIDHIVFYYVYGLFKIAVIAQQIYFRYKKGLTKDPRFSKLGSVVNGLGQWALNAIDKKTI